MLIGRILGDLPVAKTLPGAESVRWVQLECGGKILAAADLTDAHAGDLVLACQGDSADRMSPACPTDAAVVAILEESEKKVDKPLEKQL